MKGEQTLQRICDTAMEAEVCFLIMRVANDMQAEMVEAALAVGPMTAQQAEMLRCMLASVQDVRGGIN